MQAPASKQTRLRLSASVDSAGWSVGFKAHLVASEMLGNIAAGDMIGKEMVERVPLGSYQRLDYCVVFDCSCAITKCATLQDTIGGR